MPLLLNLLPARFLLTLREWFDYKISHCVVLCFCVCGKLVYTQSVYIYNLPTHTHTTTLCACFLFCFCTQNSVYCIFVCVESLFIYKVCIYLQTCHTQNHSARVLFYFCTQHSTFEPVVCGHSCHFSALYCILVVLSDT